MGNDLKKLSKFLSLVLRHKPDEIGIELDEAGWVDVDVLISGCNSHGFPLTREQLNEVVETSDKKRFAFSNDGSRIRANQGHSVEVDLGYSPTTPPDFLYHGTVDNFLPSILERGLLKGERHHVHLSPDIDTANKVGQRRGKPVILKIEAGRMAANGFTFFQSENGVWLIDHVPSEYIVRGRID
jgi:putative RNA 2'-phosphotransferase